MCFETTKSAKAKIAKTDIVCWKFLAFRLRSYYYGNYKYKKGLITPTVSLVKFRGTHIFDGYHSCKDKEFAKHRSNHTLDYSYVHKFVIPVGTRYFSNKTEYVSETIMLVE